MRPRRRRARGSVAPRWTGGGGRARRQGSCWHTPSLLSMLSTRCMRRAAMAAPLGSRSMANFTGVWPIMATPFNADETVDLEGFSKCISFMKDAGCDGTTIIGVLGESNRLMDQERESLIKTCVFSAAHVHHTFLLLVSAARQLAVMCCPCVAGLSPRRAICRSVSAQATQAPSQLVDSRRWPRSAVQRQ